MCFSYWVWRNVYPSVATCTHGCGCACVQVSVCVCVCACMCVWGHVTVWSVFWAVKRMSVRTDKAGWMITTYSHTNTFLHTLTHTLPHTYTYTHQVRIIIPTHNFPNKCQAYSNCRQEKPLGHTHTKPNQRCYEYSEPNNTHTHRLQRQYTSHQIPSALKNLLI